jgi:hypothetical protein
MPKRSTSTVRHRDRRGRDERLDVELHDRLPPQQQEQITAPSGSRRRRQAR